MSDKALPVIRLGIVEQVEAVATMPQKLNTWEVWTREPWGLSRESYLFASRDLAEHHAEASGYKSFIIIDVGELLRAALPKTETVTMRDRVAYLSRDGILYATPCNSADQRGTVAEIHLPEIVVEVRDGE